MKHILLPLFFLCLQQVYSQVYFDPAVAAATASHATVINSQLDNINDKLTLIERGQLAVTSQLTLINQLQEDLYKGLTEVSAIMRSLLVVKEISDISIDIFSNIQKAISLARDNPLLLLFAESGSREFRARANTLVAEVGSFVLKGGKDNLMDAAERAKLLNHIHVELSIIRGITYGMHRSMFWAQQKGILASLNPYSGFINIDKALAEDIIRNSKLLSK